MKLVSFYTSDDYYSYHADRLKKQCNKIGVQHIILERKFGNSWIENTRGKPLFILEMFEKLRQPFLWLDVDCEILKPFNLHLPKWGIVLNNDIEPYPLSYVHYIPYNQTSKNIILKWIEEVKQKQKGDHSAFVNIIGKCCIIPDGYFINGDSNVNSKKEWLKENT